MGIAAHLFHDDDTEKETLHRRVMPSDEQREGQTSRWNELADYLRDWLKEKTGFNVKTWIQGSYKFGTQVRPGRKGEEFDIDLGVYLEWSGEPEDEMLATVLKQHVQDAVKSFANAAEGVKGVTPPPKERCARIIYTEHFHIDVPVYHLDSDRDVRSLATETHGWETSDPKALVLWFREKAGNDDDRTQLRRIVRYMKIWAVLKFELADRPTSILLTVLATNAYRSLPSSLMDDDDVLEAVVAHMIAKLEDDAVVPNPVDANENLNRLDAGDAASFLANLRDLHETAQRGLAASTVLEASDIWSEAFEHFFPAPEEEKAGLGVPANKASTALVPVRPLEIEVIATPRNGQGRTYRATNAIGPIPKDYDVNFRVLTGLPPMADVQWMVRNSGSEAAQENDLGHRVRVNGFDAAERTAYNGSHYMDCVAKQNGRLIGYRRVNVIINDGVRRNPARPHNVQFWNRSR